MSAPLDDWLPSPSIRTRHARAARAPAEGLWEAASGVRLSDTRSLGRLVRWRIPGLSPGMTYHELFRHYPFCVLDEGDHRLLSGLCGRIWTLSRDYPSLSDASEFASWDEPGTVRVAFAHWVEPGDDGVATLCSEARVEPVDIHARLRLRATWAVVSPFERLVGAEPLALAVSRAEA